MRIDYLKYSEKISEMVLTIHQEQFTPLNLWNCVKWWM